MCETDMLLLAAALGAAIAGGTVPATLHLNGAERRDSEPSHDRAGGRSGD